MHLSPVQPHDLEITGSGARPATPGRSRSIVSSSLLAPCGGATLQALYSPKRRSSSAVKCATGFAIIVGADRGTPNTQKVATRFGGRWDSRECRCSQRPLREITTLTRFKGRCAPPQEGGRGQNRKRRSDRKNDYSQYTSVHSVRFII